WMMTADSHRSNRIGKAIVVLTAFVCVSIAIGVSYFRTQSRRKSVATVIQQIKHGEPFERMLAIRGIAQELRGQAELEQVFPHVMEATKDESDIVRDAAASALPIFVGGSDRPIAPPKTEPDAALLARCTKVEDALLALLKTKPRTRGCDLQLVPSLIDVTSIP